MRFFKNYLKPNNEKRNSYKQLALKNWKKLIHFLILQKQINAIKFLLTNKASRCSQNNKRIIIGEANFLKNKKKQKTAKIWEK